MDTPNSQKKPVRYMDFVSHKPMANADPLASRPASRPVKKPAAKVEKVHSVSDQIPPKITVKRTEQKPYISREPAKSRDLYPDPKPAKAKTDDTLAIKASAALAGTSQPAEKKTPAAPDNNAYSLGGKSPFLPNYTVDKRPLSNSVPAKKKDTNFEKLSFLGVTEDTSSKKNVYEKKSDSADKKSADKKDKKAKKSKTVRVIDDTKKKRGIPVFLIILLTIILGAAVGAGIYFILPK